MAADRWLAAIAPEPVEPEIVEARDLPAVAAPVDDPELAGIGRQMVEAIARLLVEREARERATGTAWRLRLRPPRFDAAGLPSITLTIDLEPEDYAAVVEYEERMRHGHQTRGEDPPDR